MLEAATLLSVAGSWDSGDWVDESSQTVAAPGVRGVTGDTASFSSSTGGTLALDGASPSLAAIAFDCGNASYAIDQGTGGTLHLDNGALNASISLSPASQIIPSGSAPSSVVANQVGGSFGNWDPAACTMANGWIFLAYFAGDTSDGGAEIYYQISRDGGGTWDAPSLLYTTDISGGYALAQASLSAIGLADGRVMVLWSEYAPVQQLQRRWRQHALQQRSHDYSLEWFCRQ